MSARALDALVDALLASAVRRWPAASRAEQCREWTAELAALRDGPRSGRRRFDFALSLALSPAPDDGSGLRGWRELLPGLWARLRPAAGFALLAVLVMQALPVRVGPLPVGAVLACAVVPLCLLAGRRSTVAAHPLGVAGMAVTGAALGYLAYRTAPLLVPAWVIDGRVGAAIAGGPERPLFGVLHTGAAMSRGHVTTALLFVALTVPPLAGVISLAGRRRWAAAIPLACLAVPAAAYVAWRVGKPSAGGGFDPAWSIVDARLAGGPLDLAPPGGISLGALLLLGALVTAYAFGLATRDRARAGAAAPGGEEWAPPGVTTVAGLAAAAVGLAAWVHATSVLPHWAGRDGSLATMVAESGDELSWGAILLAVLGVRVAAAHRRGATLAALLLGGWLLAVEALLTRPALLDGVLPAATAAAVAVVGAGLARWACGPGARLRGADATAARRAFAVVAVVAAACGPLLVAQVELRPGTAAPTGLAVVLGVVPAAFVALAASAAVAAGRRPVRAAAFALVPVAATATFGVAVATGAFAPSRVGLGGAGLFAVVAAAVALAGRRRAAHWGLWTAAAGLAPFVVGPAASAAAIVPAMLLDGLEGGEPYVAATSFQPGVLLVVLPVAALLARHLVRDDPRPAPAVPDQMAASG